MEILHEDYGNPYNVEAQTNGQVYLLMRYGWEKKGFLTETFHPVGAFLNRGRSLTPVWKFEKPYRIHPGESINATLMAGGAYSLDTMPAESSPAIMFNAVRLKDNRPTLLYDVSRTVDATGTVRSLSVHCDADSSMDLYSVTINAWWEFNAYTPRPAELQIYGPGGREWFHLESQPTLTALQLQSYKSGWLEYWSDYVDLGEERGWVMNSDEAFVVEFKQPPTLGSTTKLIGVTVRGVLERPND
jgi:hypothetical protein